MYVHINLEVEIAIWHCYSCTVRAVHTQECQHFYDTLPCALCQATAYAFYIRTYQELMYVQFLEHRHTNVPTYVCVYIRTYIHLYILKFCAIINFNSLCDLQLFLEAPDDILCFRFNPYKPNFVVGGCRNGQVRTLCVYVQYTCT